MAIFDSEIAMSPVMAVAVELAARQFPLSCAETESEQVREEKPPILRLAVLAQDDRRKY